MLPRAVGGLAKLESDWAVVGMPALGHFVDCVCMLHDLVRPQLAEVPKTLVAGMAAVEHPADNIRPQLGVKVHFLGVLDKGALGLKLACALDSSNLIRHLYLYYPVKC
jgi:hypothetical protein